MVGASNVFPGNNHWSDGSQPRAFVTVNDFTPSGWPVLAATNEWATEPNLDMYYNFQSCGSTGHCIDVRLADFFDSNGNVILCTGSGGSGLKIGGVAVINPDTGHMNADNTFVRLNRRCGDAGYDNRDRRALACEELGHITGLAHADGSLNDVTCMASGNIKQLHEHPRDHDFNMLHNTVYDHNDP